MNNSNNKNKFKLSNKDDYFKKNTREGQFKSRGKQIFDNFQGVMYEPFNTELIKQTEQKIRYLLDFDFSSEVWDSIQGIEPLYMVFFSMLTGARCKVKEHQIDMPYDGKRIIIPISYEIIKSRLDQLKHDNNYFINYLFSNIQDIDIKQQIYDITTKEQLIKLNESLDNRYQFFLPLFKTKNIDDYLSSRISSELCPIYRNDFKQCITLLYLSCRDWTTLKSVSVLKWYFNKFGPDPFTLNKFNQTDPASLVYAQASVTLNLILNLVLYEQSIIDVLNSISASNFIIEFANFVLSDTSSIKIKEFSDAVANGFKVVILCKAACFDIPTAYEDGTIGISQSYTDNLTDYDNEIKSMVDWARANNMESLVNIIYYCAKIADRNTILLSEFISGLPNITGYTASNQMEAVKRQVFTGRKILHEQYDISKDEALSVATEDWNKLEPILSDAYGADMVLKLKDKYFSSKAYEYDYVPKDFNCNGNEFFKNVSNHIEAFTYKVCDFNQEEVLDLISVTKKIFLFQTPNSAGGSVALNVPITPSEISKKIKLQSQAFNKKHYNDSVLITLTSKRSLIAITPTNEILSLGQVFNDFDKGIINVDDVKKILITTGLRTVTGPKNVRFIFVVPWYDNIMHQSIGYYGLKKQKTMNNLGKPRGLVIKDYWHIIRSTSQPQYLNLFLDFGVFDGSCMNYIQKPIYKAFSVKFKYKFSDQIDLDQLLIALQNQKYRCVMIIEYAGEIELLMLDMILSGELLTNLKDSLINFGLVSAALDLLVFELPDIIADRDLLQVNGDDSFIPLQIPTKYYKLEQVSTKLRRSIFTQRVLTYEPEFMSKLKAWADSLPGKFAEVGFKLSDVKGGLQSTFAEYLKVWFKFGILIAHWRVQLFTKEKTSIEPHVQTAMALVGLARTMSERGMDLQTLRRYTFLNTLNGRRISAGLFFVNNIVDCFNAGSGYSIPINSANFIFPTSTLYSLYIMMHSRTFGLPNHIISRYLVNNFTRASTKYLSEIADGILGGKASVIKNTFQFDPKINANQFNTTRDSIKIFNSVNAYKILRDMGLRISKKVAYFNGFRNYLESGLSTSKLARGFQMSENEKSNAEYFYNITNAVKPIGKLTVDMVILGNIFTNLNGSSVTVSYQNDLTNMGIGSSPQYFVLKYILGYANRETHFNYERDLLSIIESVDRDYPREISQEMLLKILLQPQYLSNPINFQLACAVMGLNEAVAATLQSTLNSNFMMYALQSNSFNFSSVSQYLTMWDLTVENIRTKMGSSNSPGELLMLDRLSTTIQLQTVLSKCIINKDKIIINGVDVSVTSTAIDAVVSARGF